MLPIFTASYELLQFLSVGSQWSTFYSGGAHHLADALAHVRVNWLFNEFGIS